MDSSGPQDSGDTIAPAAGRSSFVLHEQALGYAVLRLAIGMSMLIHGVVRLPKIPAFATQTVKMFDGSWLPAAAVGAFARVTRRCSAPTGR